MLTSIGEVIETGDHIDTSGKNGEESVDAGRLTNPFASCIFD